MSFTLRSRTLTSEISGQATVRTARSLACEMEFGQLRLQRTRHPLLKNFNTSLAHTWEDCEAQAKKISEHELGNHMLRAPSSCIARDVDNRRQFVLPWSPNVASKNSERRTSFVITRKRGLAFVDLVEMERPTQTRLAQISLTRVHIRPFVVCR